jgi:hypothetical protein
MLTSKAHYTDNIADASIFGTIYKHIGLDNCYFVNVLILDGIDVSTFVIMLMSM